MERVRYDGPGHVLHAFGRTLERGKTEEFSEQEVRQLLAQPAIRVTVEPTRAARPLPGGVMTWVYPEVPAPPSGVGEPEADNGEGHTTSSKEKK